MPGARRAPARSFATRGIRYQSFAAYLVNHTPAAVQAKLRKWGVADYQSIFMRALGLNALLAAAPERHSLADEFVRNYYRYADQLFPMPPEPGALHRPSRI